ncbi:MAG: hypothetical protein K8F91_09085 [Candidatus Obscuribacterales bacterium]|nr:hypothetical protein [Candidatus Obscuribacterales bacterium]
MQNDSPIVAKTSDISKQPPRPHKCNTPVLDPKRIKIGTTMAGVAKI